MGKIHLRLQRLRYRLVLAELTTIVEGYRVARILVVTQHRDNRFADLRRIL